MSNRLLESGDDRLLEDGTSFRLLELLFVPVPGRPSVFMGPPTLIDVGPPTLVDVGPAVLMGESQ